MTRTRNSSNRTATSRAATQRQRPVNEYQSALYIDPREIPANMTYRWVGESTLGQPMENNVVRSLRSGWRPVPSDRHPEFSPPSIPGLTDHLDRTLIRSGGLLLCERLTKDVLRDQQMAHDLSDEAVNGRDYTSESTDGVPRFDDSETMIERVTAQSFKD